MQAGTSAVLAEEIETDPRLQHALRIHLNAPHAAGGVVIDRSRMCGDTPIMVGSSGTISIRKPTWAARLAPTAVALGRTVSTRRPVT
ncbi:hypothetical protein [Streptomyces sp. bgisy031]|uniref:hypothetical protein n=1 Tax=Streptomyces sp. bgisy031 TaxID=3413772 RepID=UPI003D71FF02